MRKNIIVFLLFIFLAAIAYRIVIITPGLVGHNWDWNIPYFPEYLQNTVKLSFYTWRNLSFGQSNILYLPQGPVVNIFMLPGFFGITGDYIAKIFILLSSILSGYFMFLLLKDILAGENHKKIEFPAFIGGLFYAFSPFLFAELISGAFTQILSYAFAPLALYFLRKTLLRRTAINLFASVILISVLTTSLQILIFVSGLIFIYGLFQENKKRYYLNFFIIYLVYFLFNFYWIAPTLIGIKSEMNYDVLKPEFTSFDNVNFAVPSLREIFVGTGYFHPLFTDSIPNKILPLWYVFTYFLMSAIMLINFFTKKSKESLFWLTVFMISLVFATGGKEPLGNVVIWLYQNFPLMSLFRSAQHFIILPTLAISVLIAFASAKLPKYFWLISIFIWVFPFFTTGDVGRKVLSEKATNHFDIYNLSPDYKDTFYYLFSQNKDFRVLYLPMAGSVTYLANQYQSSGQGGDPLVAYSPFDTVNTDISFYGRAQGYAKVLEDALCKREDHLSVKRFIDLGGFKYILLRGDVTASFSLCKYGWNISTIAEYLSQIPNLKIIKDYSDIKLYENTSALSLIYPSNYLINSDNTAQSLYSAVSLNKINSDQLLVNSGGSSWISQLENKPDLDESHQIDQNIFDFSVPSNDKYELWQKNNDLGWNLDKVLNLNPGTNHLQVPPPFKNNLIGNQPEAIVLETDKESRSKVFSFEVDHPLTLQISFDYLTNADGMKDGLPPRYAIYQDTDEIINGGKSPRLSSWLIKDTIWRQSKATITLNQFTKKVDLVLFADKPNVGKTAISYKNIRVEEVFKNPVVVTSIKQKNISDKKLPSVIWKKINPTKYLVDIRNASDPFYLTFLDSYDAKWEAKINRQLQNHFMANSFANAWEINRKGDYQIVLEYWPQKIFIVASLFSGGIFALTIIYLIFIKLRHK